VTKLDWNKVRVEKQLAGKNKRGFPQRKRIPENQRKYLYVPFAEKDQVKVIGGQWDAVRKQWWVNKGTALKAIEHWLNPR